MYRYVVNVPGKPTLDAEDTVPGEPELLSRMYCCPACGRVWARIYGLDWWVIHSRFCSEHGNGRILTAYDLSDRLNSLPRSLLQYELEVWHPGETSDDKYWEGSVTQDSAIGGSHYYVGS